MSQRTIEKLTAENQRLHEALTMAQREAAMLRERNAQLVGLAAWGGRRVDVTTRVEK